MRIVGQVFVYLFKYLLILIASVILGYIWAIAVGFIDVVEQTLQENIMALYMFGWVIGIVLSICWAIFAFVPIGGMTLQQRLIRFLLDTGRWSILYSVGGIAVFILSAWITSPLVLGRFGGDGLLLWGFFGWLPGLVGVRLYAKAVSAARKRSVRKEEGIGPSAPGL